MVPAGSQFCVQHNHGKAFLLWTEERVPFDVQSPVSSGLVRRVAVPEVFWQRAFAHRYQLPLLWVLSGTGFFPIEQVELFHATLFSVAHLLQAGCRWFATLTGGAGGRFAFPMR